MDRKQAVELLSRLANSCLGVVKTLGQEIREAVAAFIKYYSDKWKNEQVETAQQTAQQNQLSLAQEIQWELYCAFSGGKRYPYLQPVQAVNDIVIYNCSHYGIPLRNINPVPPAYGLRQIINHMNQDIQIFVQTAIVYNQAQLYPCLMQGLHVINITVDGIYAVLTVAFPQQHNAITHPGGIK